MSNLNIRDMLCDYADRLRFELEMRQAATRAEGEPTTVEGLVARSAELRSQADAGHYAAQVLRAAGGLEDARQDELRLRFAGPLIVR